MEMHNKLVRDKIPEIIEKKGEKPLTRILNPYMRLQELKRKLVEEATEVQRASSRAEVQKELADVLEVVEAIRETEKIPMRDLEGEVRRRRHERGAFDKGIFLVSVEK